MHPIVTAVFLLSSAEVGFLHTQKNVNFQDNLNDTPYPECPVISSCPSRNLAYFKTSCKDFGQAGSCPKGKICCPLADSALFKGCCVSPVLLDSPMEVSTESMRVIHRPRSTTPPDTHATTTPSTDDEDDNFLPGFGFEEETPTTSPPSEITPVPTHTTAASIKETVTVLGNSSWIHAGGEEGCRCVCTCEETQCDAGGRW